MAPFNAGNAPAYQDLSIALRPDEFQGVHAAFHNGPQQPSTMDHKGYEEFLNEGSIDDTQPLPCRTCAGRHLRQGGTPHASRARPHNLGLGQPHHSGGDTDDRCVAHLSIEARQLWDQVREEWMASLLPAR